MTLVEPVGRGYPGARAVGQPGDLVAGGFQGQTALAGLTCSLLPALALVQIGVNSPLHHDEIG
jgi:hypothetical protein